MKSKDETEPLFLPASFFMVRAPLLPIEEYFSFFQNKELKPSLSEFNHEQIPILREAIAVASPELYKAITSNKETEQILSSLVKYFSRMTTRATPFGLFSFVSLGTWSSATAGTFDLTQVKKRIRPDMEWLFTIIDQLCGDPDLIPHLQLQRNPLIYESGARVCLNYYRKKTRDEKTETVSIRSSFLTRAIFEMTEKPIVFRVLLEQLVQNHPALDKMKLKAMIDQMVKQQFLCFNLHPSLLTESPFDDLLTKLSSIPFQAPLLQEVREKIHSYNKTPIGSGEDSLLDLQNSMEKSAKVPNLIQVDAAYTPEGITLSDGIKKELTEASELLWRLSHSYSFESPLRSYQEKFQEKYGIYRTVPLLDLLHEEVGLGPPDIYQKNSTESPPKEHKASKWKNWLKQEWIQCLRDKRTEIRLTDAILEKTLEKPDHKKAPLSFDLYFELYANSPSEIDKGDYLIVAFNNSWQGGATFGRFLDILGDSTKKALHAFLLEEESIEKESLFAQASYSSFISRNANVAIQPNLRRYSIDTAGSGNIALNDIYVGVTADRFYLTLRDSKQELIVTSANMLNPMTAPIPIRFVRDVANNRYQPFSIFSWMDLEDAPYLPRVRFKNTILSSSRWKVNLFQLGLTAKDSLDTIRNKFQAWSQQWDMPRYCFMGYDDNRILVDLEHPAHLSEITSQLKKDMSVAFFEKIEQTKGQWMKSQRGTHIAEFVLPFVKNPKYAESEKIHVPDYKPVTPSHRLKLPGSEWLYLKCYLSTDQENRFLVDHCYRFVGSLFEQKIITDWFFVRYGDAKSHLRLRFKGEKENIVSKLLPTLHDWSHTLIQERCINDMVLSAYDREVERYGGEELIESAEALFCADSLTAVSLVNAILSKKTALKEEIISAVSVINLLQGFGMNLKQQLEFFTAATGKTEELKGFREHKSSLLSLGEAALQNTLQNHSQEGKVLCDAFQVRQPTLSAFSAKLQEIESRKTLATPPFMIYDSIVHMHCNRLLGREAKRESKARLYAFHTLKIINEKKNRSLS